MSAYKWASGARCAVDANVAGAVCEELEAKGELTAERLVEVSRNEDAPLHGAFEWDDAIAAEKYRQTQAYCILRWLCKVVDDGTAEPIRAFFPVEVRHYENITTIMQTENKRKQILDRALAELKAFRAKYGKLTELARVFSAITAVVDDGAV